jgi:hypothetical protein
MSLVEDLSLRQAETQPCSPATLFDQTLNQLEPIGLLETNRLHGREVVTLVASNSQKASNEGCCIPIRWRICNPPEAGCGPREFHRNLCWSHRVCFYGNDAAFSLFPAGEVLQQEPLPNGYKAG